jgi:pimeloyl-ACP methyl ester carboxylesterase
MTVKAFTINISQATLDDLHNRLSHTRWPDEIEGAGWDYGTNLDYLKSTDIGLPLNSELPDLSEAEKQYLSAVQQWRMQEGAYAMMHSTKPQTLAYGLNDSPVGLNDSPVGLNDSPVGLAAWILEKFRSWSDCDGNVEQRFSKDELLTNIMIYWVTETINSSVRMYYENVRMSPPLKAEQHIEVPAGVAIFSKDILHPPRELAERSLRVQRWTQMPRGGHFAVLEEPELLAEDIRAFFRPLRASI